MHMRARSSWSLVIVAALVAGCSKPAATPAPAGPTPAGASVTPTGGVPEGNKVVCHLACSGTEAKGYGATEADARADVARYISQNCKPEDGQYFIFCDPPQ